MSRQITTFLAIYKFYCFGRDSKLSSAKYRDQKPKIKSRESEL